MPTVPHKQKLGILTGISLQLAMSLLRNNEDEPNLEDVVWRHLNDKPLFTPCNRLIWPIQFRIDLSANNLVTICAHKNVLYVYIFVYTLTILPEYSTLLDNTNQIHLKVVTIAFC
jgi:hypothetical protein